MPPLSVILETGCGVEGVNGVVGVAGGGGCGIEEGVGGRGGGRDSLTLAHIGSPCHTLTSGGKGWRLGGGEGWGGGSGSVENCGGSGRIRP